MLRTLVAILFVSTVATPAARAGEASRPKEKPADKSKDVKKPAPERAPERPAVKPEDRNGADSAYSEAKKAYAALKKDEKRRKFRDQWIAVAQKFEAVADKFAVSPHAAEALFDAAELYAELSRVSLAKRDLKEAIEAYARLCEKYPRSALADDAHLALGRIYRDRQGDTATAEAEFKAAAACKGDMQEKAKAELTALQSLPKPAVKAEPAKAEEKPKLVKAEPPKPELARHEEKPAEKPAADRREDKAQAQAKAPDPAQKLTLSARDEEDDEEEADAVNIPLPKRTALDPARVKALKSAAKSEVPLSVQVGLKVKRIVIDPGHGGHDVGATGPSGVNEADVTLAISKRLKEKLEAEGYEALLTREADSFVSLEDRARFANKHKGDLFVSVHCNAHKVRKLRGVETYTLNVTSDQYSIRLAARENAASERSLSDLQFILADLATKANTSDSVRLARAVQSELVEAESEGKEKAKNLGVKQALFYVLLGAHMPSVLVETAFLSNPDDEKRLNDPAQQDGIAQAIAEGVGRFVAERDALATALTE